MSLYAKDLFKWYKTIYVVLNLLFLINDILLIALHINKYILTLFRMDSITLNRFTILCLIPQSWALKMFPLFYFFSMTNK